MIVAIADDITGAAEIAGIGLRYGLKTIVSPGTHFEHQPDLMVIYTNTRSMQQAAAVDQMKKLTSEARKLNPALFYKKTDSVLRGHVMAELEAQMKVMGCTKALLIPANPKMGRIITKGLYYVKDELLHKTGFSSDPEFPIRTSAVEELVSGEKNKVAVCGPGSSLGPGITIGETETNEDVYEWTNYRRGDTLMAGGGSFFNALLERDYKEKKNTTVPELQYPLLFVSGTAFHKDDVNWKELRETTSLMPDEIFFNSDATGSAMEVWSGEIIAILKKYDKVFVAIGHSKEKGDPDMLRKKLGQVANLVLDKHPVRELIIEGGSTAYTIVTSLDSKVLVPVEELAHGVVRMKPEGNSFFLTIKPGSYQWPEKWDFN